jgi:S1-C subfamily serine protease
MIVVFTVPARGTELRDSVVKIHSSHRPPDFLRPWTKGPARQATGSGVIIEGQRILTNAHVVQYSSRLLVQGYQSTDRVPAHVVGFAPDMDLALLELDDDSFFEKRSPLSFADGIPKLKETVNVYGYPIGGDQLSITEGIISRIEFMPYINITAGLRIQIDAALNPGNSGGPAIANRKIVGLVFSGIPTAENIGYLIPAEEIRLFLEDLDDGKYDGKYKMLDEMQTVRNPALRERLQLPAGTGGVLIRKPFREEEDYPLKEWDVVTRIGDVDLDQEGNVQVEDNVRLAFRYLIPRFQQDGQLPLTIFRDGKEQQIQLSLILEPEWLVRPLKGKYPRHFIFGPIVFSVGTQDLLRAAGQRGEAMLANRRNPLIRRRYDLIDGDEKELVVTGARMFPHPIHEGYDPQTFAVVSHLNDEPVNSLAQLMELIRGAEGEFITFRLAGKYETLVFPRQEMFDITEEILENEGIRYQYSKDLAPVWEEHDEAAPEQGKETGHLLHLPSQ